MAEPILSKNLESVTDEEYKKDLTRFKETHTDENFRQIENYLGLAHDKAYDSFKNKFDELANHKNEPLAEIGKELTTKHLNDLLESYVTEFTRNAKGDIGESLVSAYNNMKFKDEDERHGHLQQLASHTGMNTGSDKAEQNPFLALASILKKNDYRSHTVAQDFSSDIKKIANQVHRNSLWDESFGKAKYKNSSDLLIKTLNSLSDGRYDIDIDKDGKSKFNQYDIHQFKEHVVGLHKDGVHLNDKHLKDYGLKLKPAEYKD